jgi:hypothetical protein
VGTCTWHLMRVWNLLRAQVSLTNPANETGAELYMLVVFVYHYNIGQSSLGLGARFSLVSFSWLSD